MPERKVDVIVGKDSFADQLRKRRNAIEEGDPTGGQEQKNEPAEPVPPMTHHDHTKGFSWRK